MAFNFGASQSAPLNNSFQSTQQPSQQSSIYLPRPNAQQSLLGNSVYSSSVYNNQSNTAASTPAIIDQLQKIKSSWDPLSPDCAFQYFFYNKVAPEQSIFYGKPAAYDQLQWDAAIAARPDASSVPVLAVGFADLQKRVTYQEQQVVAYRSRMHEINTRLTDLIRRHDLYSTVRISELKARHTSLSHRTMSLAVKIQVLKSRGYALRPDEELLKRKFEALTSALGDPAVFGKLNEVWARMTIVKNRITLLNEQTNQTGEQWRNAIDQGRDEDQLEKIARILKGQQAGLIYLAQILQQDTLEVNKLIGKLKGEDREDEKIRGQR
ncbi:nucleoporin complex subunit 54-domain-containing protein [Lipomyces arxii]|uniref:nucleoporin complex subunit 54-domain-containing protein n=1 Tax=Lipomyces arxii TaxID=56418 RepID=UPI0034CFF705